MQQRQIVIIDSDDDNQKSIREDLFGLWRSFQVMQFSNIDQFLIARPGLHIALLVVEAFLPLTARTGSKLARYLLQSGDYPIVFYTGMDREDIDGEVLAHPRVSCVTKVDRLVLGDHVRKLLAGH